MRVARVLVECKIHHVSFGQESRYGKIKVGERKIANMLLLGSVVLSKSQSRRTGMVEL